MKELPLIVVIDRNAGIRELYATELGERGFEVITTGDFVQAVKMIESAKPDLVLIDPSIKGENRWDVVADIKKVAKHVPVVLCLAFAPDENNPFLVLSDDYVVKSSSTAHLISKVESLLNRRFNVRIDKERWRKERGMISAICERTEDGEVTTSMKGLKNKPFKEGRRM
ncbi:MAG: Phosphate regulon transcriptional regulatory protein PhoB [Syntrophorhabdaceae bacterium PtaU1.Bin034]|nr:MAG: Phosphate regulon transcriptional regulatory protein PhoB [Syntrophorhabdaceae bacterium PtaU1.Bin034]